MGEGAVQVDVHRAHFSDTPLNPGRNDLVAGVDKENLKNSGDEMPWERGVEVHGISPTGILTDPAAGRGPGGVGVRGAGRANRERRASDDGGCAPDVLARASGWKRSRVARGHALARGKRLEGTWGITPAEPEGLG